MRIPPPPITLPQTAIRESEVWYFHPQTKTWNKTAAGASLRYQSQRRLQVQGVIEGRLQKHEAGRWQPDQSQDKAPWWWRAYAHMQRGKRWLVLEGPRPMERGFWEETGKVPLYSLAGELIREPELAGTQFMLDLDDARAWSKHLQANNLGTIVPWQKDDSEAAHVIQSMRSSLEKITTWEQEAGRLAKQGALTEIHTERLDSSYSDLLGKANDDLSNLASLVSVILAVPDEETDLITWARAIWEEGVMVLAQMQTTVRNHNLRKIALLHNDEIPDPLWHSLQATLVGLFGKDRVESKGGNIFVDGVEFTPHGVSAKDAKG